MVHERWEIAPCRRRHAARGNLALVALVTCLTAVPFGGVAVAGGTVAIGANAGVALPNGDSSLGAGGVWHVSLGVTPSQSLAMALELGTAANETDADRTVVVSGVTREVTLHAVSTLGVVARQVLRAGRLHPYLAGGVGLYTSWDEIRATATQPADTITRSGMGLHAGAGLGLRLSGRWDLYGEGLYHFAPKAEDDARFFALQGGLRFHFGHRRPSS